MDSSASASAPAAAPAPEPAPAPAPMQPQPMPDMGMGMGMPGAAPMMQPMPDMNMGMYQQPYAMPPGYGMPYGMPMQSQPMMQPMNIQPAQFQSFAGGIPAGAPANIDLIMDVSLEVTVELGRTKKSISEVLEFTPGTIIELDKVAGEPVEVLVNGKLVAKGEVVVIEESFGVRITEIIK